MKSLTYHLACLGTDHLKFVAISHDALSAYSIVTNSNPSDSSGSSKCFVYTLYAIRGTGCSLCLFRAYDTSKPVATWTHLTDRSKLLAKFTYNARFSLDELVASNTMLLPSRAGPSAAFIIFAGVL